eukprot:CAMPEP_0201186284 /NCGR_PEP_ID=MMETSP0851-20130426/130869_1 /ASSEMBLY_ACC=CAM_ASM_000631 /TAXON_ID=183588 /ORGANISM="Pseudo-nitzschia fraudulenta, Strain WWA7" /LENGTH=317 /DNA_ID=CAMNT_0047471563 /DNA_START=29 /DNA_END=982 /DNA_ORIENTATION=+
MIQQFSALQDAAESHPDTHIQMHCYAPSTENVDVPMQKFNYNENESFLQSEIQLHSEPHSHAPEHMNISTFSSSNPGTIICERRCIYSQQPLPPASSSVGNSSDSDCIAATGCIHCGIKDKRNSKSNSNNISNDYSCVNIDVAAIYRSALNLLCHGDCTEAFDNPVVSCSREDTARIRASILFNLGLLHHIYAVEFSSQSMSMDHPNQSSQIFQTTVRILEKANTCYKLSLRLQEMERSPISTVYVMALCNNIGQCLVALNRKQESNEWMERLLRLLVCQQQKRTISDDGASPPLNECFVRSTSSIILTDPCIAPTA